VQLLLRSLLNSFFKFANCISCGVEKAESSSNTAHWHDRFAPLFDERNRKSVQLASNSRSLRTTTHVLQNYKSIARAAHSKTSRGTAFLKVVSRNGGYWGRVHTNGDAVRWRCITIPFRIPMNKRKLKAAEVRW